MKSGCSPFTPEERDAWRALQKVKPRWRTLYGWRMTPVYRKSEIVITDAKPEIIGYRKQFNLQTGAIILSAPLGTHKEGMCYVVWDDHTLRAITKETFDMLATVPPIARVPMLKGEKTLKKAA